MATARKKIKAKRDSKRDLKKILEDPVVAQAARTLLGMNDPGDPPSAADVEADFDFLAYNPTEVESHLAQHGIERDPTMEYRWCDRDPRSWPRRKAQGWEPIKGGALGRGSTFLCQMPKIRVESARARIRQRTADLMAAPMKRFEMDVDKYKGKHFQTFDGPRSVRDGLD